MYLSTYKKTSNCKVKKQCSTKKKVARKLISIILLALKI